MGILKTAAQIAEETVGGATAKVGGEQTARQLLLGYDPKLSPGYSGRNAAPRVDNNLVNYVAPSGATGRVPRGSAQQTMDELAPNYQGPYTPFSLREVPAESRVFESTSSYNATQTAAPVAPAGTTIPELLTSHARRGNLNAANAETNARRAQKLRAREEYYSPAQSGLPPEGPAERIFTGGESGIEGVGNVPSSLDHLINVADETGSVVGLLRRQNEILESRAGLLREAEIESSRPTADMNMGRAFERGEEYRRLGVESDLINQNVQRIENAASPSMSGSFGPRNDSALYSEDLYNEATHTRANLTTATEAVTEGSTSGNFVPGTLAFNETSSSNSLLGMGDAAGLGGIGASMGLGAVLGGATSYATGGEFSEGAIMGGLAGGGINIGARAIRANQSGIESFLQKKVLGNAMTDNRLGNAELISTMAKDSDAMGNLGFMQRAAANRLTTDPNKSAGLQSRHMVVGGSMLAGVAFTGRRNDKRRGFNAHRGNRI